MKSNATVKTIMMVALLLLVSAAANAQSTRTWVSGVGDDANPCSRTAPCKTFAGAISKTAAGGVINTLDSGGFGAVTITKAITIENPTGTVGGVLVSGTNAIIINAGASDTVVLRGLTIEGLGTGLNAIRFIAGLSLFVENCEINRFTQKGIDFEPADSGERFLFVKDTIIRNNNFVAGGGIFIKPGVAATVRASLDRVRIERNAFGVKAEDRSTVTIRDSVIARSANEGIWSFSSGLAATVINIEGTMTTHNGTGIKSEGNASVVRIANVSVFGNTNGLISLSGAILSFGNNNNADNGTPTGTLGQQ